MKAKVVYTIQGVFFRFTFRSKRTKLPKEKKTTTPWNFSSRIFLGRFSKCLLPHIRNGKNFSSINHRPRPRPRGRPLLTEVQEGSTTFRDMPWGRGIEVKAEAKSVWGFLGNYCNGGKRTHPRTFSKENKIWRKIGVLMLYKICTELL